MSKEEQTGRLSKQVIDQYQRLIAGREREGAVYSELSQLIRKSMKAAEAKQAQALLDELVSTTHQYCAVLDLVCAHE